ncbi:uncharacterized protein LOC131802467 [Musca domestica]|uniref:Uncharacterized protein LOC131802467 n=1 Tax=Musca domestica TaxID=7370 RepID=A0ABM3UZ39_MUSDO|nr:uncharacterized protein LOC131802467 [Musca domestica]
MKYIAENGIQFAEHIFSLEIRAIVCDAPAKAYICGIPSHASFHGCSKCTQVGKKIGNVLTYSTKSGDLITDDDFENRKYLEHHLVNFRNTKTPLEIIGVKMISQVSIDTMHLLDLGIMRKFILRILEGKTIVKVSKRDKICMSKKLESLKTFVPQEFVRKPRSFDDIAHWKATEFRQFLLYTGIFVFKDLIPDDTYYVFLLLHCACRLLLCPKSYHNNLEPAKQLLRRTKDIHWKAYEYKDKSTYKLIREDPTTKLQRLNNNIIAELHKKDIITKWEKSKLTSIAAAAPDLYGLPKIHKENIPLRPIASSINVPCYNLAQYIDLFVHNFPIVFGDSSVSYNIHTLLHLVDSIRDIGLMSGSSAYDFENYLQTMGKYVKKPTNILQQIFKRVQYESYFIDIPSQGFRTMKNKGVCYYFNKCLYTSKKPDNFCCIKPYIPIEIQRFEEEGEEKFVIGKRLTNIISYLKEPMDSMNIGICCADVSSLGDVEKFSILEINFKFMCISHNDNVNLLPILHSCL